MREYVARLIRAGMPRSVAVSVCRQFARRGEEALASYVSAVEDEYVDQLQPEPDA